jgi:exodeoxyribonuclease X
MIIRVLDLETTGTEPEDDVLEIGAVDVVTGEAPRVIGSSLVKPEKPIPPVASSIHHIVDGDVTDAQPWRNVWPPFLDHEETDGVVAFAAHNAKFEAMFLNENMLRARPLICTYKAALRVWPQFESHSNQALRYQLACQVDRQMAMPPHRALPDAYVTAFILAELLKRTTLEEMIRWTAEPAVYPKVNFGKKHRGALWTEVPPDYLDWIIHKSELDDDTKWNARNELNRRAAAEIAARQAYVNLARFAASQALTLQDLKQWFIDEKEGRAQHGIYEGTAEYDSIVSACADRKRVLSQSSSAENGEHIPTNLPTEQQHGSEHSHRVG